jgi:hypothetical protein
MYALFIDRACQFNPKICALFIGKNKVIKPNILLHCLWKKDKRFNPTTFVEFMGKTNNLNPKFVRCSPIKHCDFSPTFFTLFNPTICALFMGETK